MASPYPIPPTKWDSTDWTQAKWDRKRTQVIKGWTRNGRQWAAAQARQAKRLSSSTAER